MNSDKGKTLAAIRLHPAVIVLGGLAGFAVLLKLYWQQLLAMFGLRRAEADTASEPPAVDSEIEIKAPPEQQ